MVRLIGFDQGSVLLRENDRWIVKATVSAQERSENEFSHTLLEQVLNERRTFFEGQEEAGATASLIRCSLAAASPIYEGATDNVKGAVYGARFGIGPSGSKAITPVEARLLQCLAGVVSVGTARAEHQEESHSSTRPTVAVLYRNIGRGIGTRSAAHGRPRAGRFPCCSPICASFPTSLRS